MNELLTKKALEKIVGTAFRKVGNYRTVQFLDALKNLGFYYATKSGISFGLDNLTVPGAKEELINEAAKRVSVVQKQYDDEIITEGERYNKVIDIWTSTTINVAAKMFEHMAQSDGGFNPVYMMADSGARGSREQIRQLAGMRGLMAKPQKSMVGSAGEIIESPITANFREGLSVLEYFISTHGARKGLADTALKTADAGYLTRRLVDVAQDVVAAEEDCGTIRGLDTTALKEAEEIIEPLEDRVLGRVALDDVRDPITNELLVKSGEEIDEAAAERIGRSSVQSVRVRSVLTCESRRGICAKCYGRNLTTGKMVTIGEAVGIMAAQSIGEPGTQLTLRTFHIGGTASRIAAESHMAAKITGRVRFEPSLVLSAARDEGYVTMTRNGKMSLLDQSDRVVITYNVPYGAKVLVEEGQHVEANQHLFLWDPYTDVIIATHSGLVRFEEIISNVTFREEADEAGRKQRVVIESRDRKLTPKVNIVSKSGKKTYAAVTIPIRSNLVVRDGDAVAAGDVLVKIPKEIGKTRDITGGLPRVAELFEARKPKEPAVVSEIDGTVEFGKMRRGVREILVESPQGETRKYSIPYGKHVLVHPGDFVRAGERLSEGAVVPQDILDILGAGKVQEYLVDEIQEVYRLQGVRINDKHIEVIVRQMMQKVLIEDPGDTDYLEGDRVNKMEFYAENERIAGLVVVTSAGESKFAVGEVMEKERFGRTNERLEKVDKKPAKARRAKPATSQPLLMGITRASLNTESFISAASFQETTRVLTDAAVSGRIDQLRGLKENVIMGRLIPAGTGLGRYRDLIVSSKHDIEMDLARAEAELAEVPALEPLPEVAGR